jgi:hypothetical protein
VVGYPEISVAVNLVNPNRQLAFRSKTRFMADDGNPEAISGIPDKSGFR